MEEASSPLHPPSDDDAWWITLDEGYWRALLEQGEVPTQSVPPADGQEIYGPPVGADLLDLSTADASKETGGHSPSQDEWQIAQDALDRGDLFRLRVCGANRGGLLVEWNGLQGFVPASHLMQMSQGTDPQERLSGLLNRIGDSLKVRLIEVDRFQKRLVMSERAAESNAASPAEVLSSLRPGDTRRGRVTNLTSFGAFVDLGGVEGPIHVSELAWQRVRHPSEVLHPGQEIDVYVLGVRPEERRVALSLKRMRPNPWMRAEALYRIGQVVEGKVTSVLDFGAFVCVEDGLEGLLHASEMGDGAFLHPRSLVREGDNIRVRILSIDAANRRMGLSLRQARDWGQATQG
jgi:small subunit ribosomal protein S1